MMRFLFSGFGFFITVILEYFVGTASVLAFLLVPVGVISVAIGAKQFIWRSMTWSNVISIVVGSISATVVMAVLFSVIISAIDY